MVLLATRSYVLNWWCSSIELCHNHFTHWCITARTKSIIFGVFTDLPTPCLSQIVLLVICTHYPFISTSIINVITAYSQYSPMLVIFIDIIISVACEPLSSTFANPTAACGCCLRTQCFPALLGELYINRSHSFGIITISGSKSLPKNQPLLTIGYSYLMI